MISTAIDCKFAFDFFIFKSRCKMGTTLKIGINGFGRIGRLVYRQIYKMPGIDVVAINDLTSPKTLAHLLKYDSAQGRFDAEVKHSDNSINVNGEEVKIYAQKDPAQIPWKEHEIDVVIECTGFFADKDKASAHLTAGAKRVVISAPATGDLKTVVFNVNHNILDGSETVISCASCTTNCLAPMAKVLQEKYGIVNGLMTTVHAYTNDQNTLDAPHPKGDLRRARAAAANIVPNSTGAAKAIGLVLPELKGKLDGSAQRVPTITGSLTELTAILGKKVTAEEVNAAMKEAANESFGYTEDEIVSSDVIGMHFGSLFDATQTRVQTVGDTQMVRTVSWYDNEMSYVSQLVRTVKYFAEQIQK
ncbi:glyceraldehyde 3-phosphate dehydrogenase [Chitinophaga jiangningensis]|uniref:Glyceraldehyde-3-phosphate dehydrogenase n=2 Tax=Chitinophaga jiangningensis TaxID=1419482 RepID=A0A1M7H0K6_9BACT|nr:glyceraldehyde 3-phosphate dehydrogenase [Chitinophaga jiangningensis]